MSVTSEELDTAIKNALSIAGETVHRRYPHALDTAALEGSIAGTLITLAFSNERDAIRKMLMRKQT